jgi:hypothetical protein
VHWLGAVVAWDSGSRTPVKLYCFRVAVVVAAVVVVAVVAAVVVAVEFAKSPKKGAETEDLRENPNVKGT